MALDQKLSKGQTAAISTVVVVVVGLLIWGAIMLRTRPATTVRPREVAPSPEAVVAGAREEPVPAGPPTSAEQARRQEALQNLKWGARHGQ
jgi:hypothetical protein